MLSNRGLVAMGILGSYLTCIYQALHYDMQMCKMEIWFKSVMVPRARACLIGNLWSSGADHTSPRSPYGNQQRVSLNQLSARGPSPCRTERSTQKACRSKDYVTYETKTHKDRHTLASSLVLLFHQGGREACVHGRKSFHNHHCSRPSSCRLR